MEKSDWQKKGEGHRRRLRERFLSCGLEGFSDSDVLELLLTLGTPRRDCKGPARSLLARFGSLAGSMDAGQAELELVAGIGPKNAFALHLVQAVARRYLRQRVTGRDYLRSSREVADYLVHSMRGLKREVLMVILLDTSLAVLDSLIVAEGTLASNTVHPRELIKLAVEKHAAALVVAHNHPSGSVTPSEEDRRLTRHLFIALAFAEIRLLDHLIIGNAEQPFSFADHGLLDEIRRESQALLAGR
jgi:DNA repair protein RadC